MWIRRFASYLGAYLLWIVVLGLAILFAIVSQTALLGLAAVYFVDDLYTRQTLVLFLDKAYMFILGLGWMVLMVTIEESFRRSISKGNLLKRFAIVGGIELLAIFIFDLIILGLQDWRFDPLRTIILIIELVGGLGLLYYWRKH